MAYSPVEWNTGDVITAAKLNNMDKGIVDNENEITNVAEKADSIFKIVQYSYRYTAQPGDNNYTNITAGDFGITEIPGYKASAILSFYSGSIYTTFIGIRGDITNAVSSVVTLYNHNANAAVTENCVIKILYVREDCLVQ